MARARQQQVDQRTIMDLRSRTSKEAGAKAVALCRQCDAKRVVHRWVLSKVKDLGRQILDLGSLGKSNRPPTQSALYSRVTLEAPITPSRSLSQNDRGDSARCCF
jgi:hypothetical protein